ncbi:hypothetical protein BpHYR1_001034 [Brachionus plicatilis]|uniref:Uncharacterized protein n=1 Tax=Brachionus plicatilis TaxID=10195 RepID=A0A3M7QE10_BRAPC|nr:hypothetical protein BpHYR1_001034 [Brachionus plicatilis]
MNHSNGPGQVPKQSHNLSGSQPVPRNKKKREFLNTIKIKLPKDIVPTRLDIFNGVKELLNGNHLDTISSICPYRSNSTWLVSFKDAFDARKLLNLDIEIKSIIVKTLDPNFLIDNCIFKVLHLPHNVSEYAIGQHFMKAGLKKNEITEIIRVKCKEKEMGHYNTSYSIVRLLSYN